MSNNTVLSTNVGNGDTINTTDCSTFTAISTTGKMPGSLIFTSTATNVAPAAVIDTRPLPVCVRNSSGTTLGDATTPLQVSVANTAANSTAIKVDGSAVTQPVSGTFWQTTQPISAASLPLPSGASTAAKQPALGTAGSASSDVITVQGIASMTALKVDGSGVTQPVSGTVTANIGTSGSLALDASVNGLLVAQGSTTSGQSGPLIQTATTTSAPSYTTAKTNPLSTTTSGALRSDITTIAGTAPTTAGKIDIKGADGDVLVRQTTGSNLHSTTDAQTANGCSIAVFNSAASNNLTAVKASAGNIYSIVVVNTTATIYYLKLFDGTPTMGTTSAIGNIPIPANTSGAGIVIPIPVGLSFATNISVALTGAISLTDNTNAATGVCVNVIYK